MLDILSQELLKQNIIYRYLSGKTKHRKEEVRAFNEDEANCVFLLNLKAVGTGLNLVSADHAIIFDL